MGDGIEAYVDHFLSVYLNQTSGITLADIETFRLPIKNYFLDSQSYHCEPRGFQAPQTRLFRILSRDTVPNPRCRA